MLKITDLKTSKNLENSEMAKVRGGFNPFTFLASSSTVNKVADVEQMFQFGLAQGNTGAVTNNQSILGGNGVDFAAVHQTQDQHSDMRISDIGNITVF